MANTVNGILTTYGSTVEVELTYFFAVTSAGFAPNREITSYMFIGKPDAWLNDVNPPVPNQSQSYIKQTFKHMFAAKLLNSSNMSPIVPRIDWTSGSMYDEYSDQIDMFETDSNGILIKQFYVRNHYDQIFKCLFNNNGGASTVEPILQAGVIDATQTIYLADGYKWIYVATIDKGLKKNFFDNNWMPLAVGNVTPNPLLPAELGSINAINVTNSGNNYANGTYTTTINIVGDGSGAAAYANVTNNRIVDVVVTDSGNNYTYAETTIVPAFGFSGSGATANTIISPIGGHGTDPVSELGCNHIMISVEINDGENGNIPNDVSFRQLGLIVNPLLKNGTLPTAPIYNTSDLATVSFGSGNFISGETVYQGTTLATAGFTATVCSFDSTNNVVSLINTYGTPTLSSAIYGSNSGTSRVLLQYNPTNFSVGSGYMMYFENRQPVQRSPNGNEQLRLILRF